MVFSMLGYIPDTLAVTVPAQGTLAVFLRPSPIILPEVVVTSEDPAIEIIRRAIANKRRWIDRLLTYRMEAFTRQELLRDTSIASIAESYTRGFWRQGDTLRETVLQRRQTANLQSGFNIASVGGLLNFNDERIRFIGYAFVGPTALDALDYYDYRLVRTRTSHAREVYEIRMIPRTRTTPLFDGTVIIENDSYALAGIDVTPNEAFLIPFVKVHGLRYRQQFGLYERTFWLPVDVRVEGAFDVSIPGISFPRFGLSQTSVIYDYAVNVPIPDSIFGRRRLVVDSVALKRDTTLWTAAAVLPLNAHEEEAYKTLDSTQKLEVQFRPGGLTASFGGNAGGAFSVLKYLDASFTRVEGFRLGGRADVEQLAPWLGVRGGWSYAFTERRWHGAAGLTVFPTVDRQWAAGIDVYRGNAAWPDRGYFGATVISLAALFEKIDYRDYHRADGWRAFARHTAGRSLSLEAGYTTELHSPLEKRTDFSILFPSRAFRGNPAADPGMLRSVDLSLRIGRRPEFLDVVFHDGLELGVESASRATGPSAFRFTRYQMSGWLSFPTTAEGFLFRPGFRVLASAGGTAGSPPVQRLFGIESSAGGLAPFGVMRGARVREFSGRGFASFAVEHNFRSVPFLALGIPFLYENATEVIVHAGAARTWGTPVPGSVTTDGWYTEAGIGISRILQIFRVDLTWRFHAPRGLNLTFSAAPLM
jgi:hypothetical protein